MFEGLFGGSGKSQSPGDSAEPSGAGEKRSADWAQALGHGKLPDFVQQRLQDTASGKRPWISTMAPGELALARSHGIRPLGLVSGNCWFHYGYSWTEGHREGWRTAVSRMTEEARLLGANAIVDVTLKTTHFGRATDSMDYAVRGTAIRIDGLPASADPVTATVSALEFVRMLELGVVPVGLAVGAHYEWLTDGPYGMRADLAGTWVNTEASQLSMFAEMVRRQALSDLRADGAMQGTGVLGHSQFFEIFRIERDKMPAQYLARYIAMGTTIQHKKAPMLPWYATNDDRMKPGDYHRLGVGASIDLAEPTSLLIDRIARAEKIL